VAVPLGVVTVTVTGPAPAEAAGAVILIVVAVFVLMVAAALPNVTEIAPARFVPVMLTNVPAANGPESGETTVIVGAVTGSLTFTHVIPDIPDPPLLITVKLTDQFPATNVCVALLVVLNGSHAVTVRLFRPHFHDVGMLVEVSLNTIVNGATPAQPCEVVLVATDVFLELKLVMGAGLRLNSTRAPINAAEIDASVLALRLPIPASATSFRSPPDIRISGVVAVVELGA